MNNKIIAKEVIVLFSIIGIVFLIWLVIVICQITNINTIPNALSFITHKFDLLSNNQNQLQYKNSNWHTISIIMLLFFCFYLIRIFFLVFIWALRTLNITWHIVLVEKVTVSLKGAFATFQNWRKSANALHKTKRVNIKKSTFFARNRIFIISSIVIFCGILSCVFLYTLQNEMYWDNKDNMIDTLYAFCGSDSFITFLIGAPFILPFGYLLQFCIKEVKK